MTKSTLMLATVVSDLFEENCYLAQIEGRNDCLVIDPGLAAEQIIAELEERQAVPAAILITHGHSDHIAGSRALKERWPESPLVIGAADAPKLTNAQLNLSAPFGFPLTCPPADRTVTEGEIFAAAGFDLHVLEVPGHSAGHVVYLWKEHAPQMAFVGDVIFAGSIGRSDFPDGDYDQLITGIRTKLYTLPDDTILLPGHGPATTVGQEKRTNPFASP